MFVLVHGGGVGCELERRNIIPLMKEMFETLKSWSGNSRLSEGLMLKYIRHEELQEQLQKSNSPSAFALCSDCSELTLGGMMDFDGQWSDGGGNCWIVEGNEAKTIKQAPVATGVGTKAAVAGTAAVVVPGGIAIALFAAPVAVVGIAGYGA